MAEQNEDWSFEVNLVGVEPATGGNRDVNHQDYYTGKVTKMYTKSDSPDRVVILIEIDDGNYKGATVVTGLNKPKGPEAGVRYYWRAAAESVGHDPAALDKGDITLNKDAFVGRKAHFFYTPKALASNGYASVDFLPPAVWKQRKEGFTPVEAPKGPSTLSSGGSGASTLGGGSGGASTLGGSGTTNSDDVKAKLGL